jgi:hypothetical protein
VRGSTWIQARTEDNTRCMQDAGNSFHARNSMEKRSVLLFTRKMPYALRRCLGEVGKARLHTWGCPRWISPVALKPKAAQFDRNSPHRRKAKTTGTEIAELEGRRPLWGTRAS